MYPGTAIAHAHGPACSGNGPGLADQLQQPHLAGTKRPVPVEINAQREPGHGRIRAGARGARADPGQPARRLLDPAVKLATSTPGADPGGDYAWAVFARAEQVHRGAKAILEGKAQQLVGGPSTAPLVPGRGPSEGVFLSRRADVMLGYCSGTDALRRTVQDLVALPLPPELEVGPEHGMTVLSGNPAAARFAPFVMSGPGHPGTARVDPGHVTDKPGASAAVTMPHRTRQSSRPRHLQGLRQFRQPCFIDGWHHDPTRDVQADLWRLDSLGVRGWATCLCAVGLRKCRGGMVLACSTDSCNADTIAGPNAPFNPPGAVPNAAADW